MPTINLKNFLYSALLLPSLCYANWVLGVGEFHYGPDTDDNTACEYALQRAKQDAIRTHLGEEIESFTSENCSGEKSCNIDIDTYTQMFGIVKQITNKKTFKYEDYGQKVCKVVLDAIVERVENKTAFNVTGKLKYFEGDEMELSVSSNITGFVSIYNFYDGQYVRIHDFQLSKINTEQKITRTGERILARLPPNAQQSKESLVIIFSKEKPYTKKRYSVFEFSSMISSLDSKVKRTVFRYVTIGKKL